MMFRSKNRFLMNCRHRRINIEEATGTSYMEINSLSFPFYTDLIIIVWGQTDEQELAKEG